MAFLELPMVFRHFFMSTVESGDLCATMLSIRTAWKGDFQGSSMEMVYGQTLCLPGELLSIPFGKNNLQHSKYRKKELRQHVRDFRPCGKIL